MWLSVLHSVGYEEALCKLTETLMKGLMESEASHGKNGKFGFSERNGGRISIVPLPKQFTWKYNIHF